MEGFNMKIIMRRDFVIFQNREIGYAKGGTFLMKDFNQKQYYSGCGSMASWS